MAEGVDKGAALTLGVDSGSPVDGADALDRLMEQQIVLRGRAPGNAQSNRR